MLLELIGTDLVCALILAVLKPAAVPLQLMALAGWSW